jgi:hypothetical protein
MEGDESLPDYQGVMTVTLDCIAGLEKRKYDTEEHKIALKETGSEGVDATREKSENFNVSQVLDLGFSQRRPVEYNVVQFSKNRCAFRSNLLPPSSVSKRKA